jgi:hypothetical protein
MIQSSEHILQSLEKQSRQQARYQRYGNAITLCSFVLLLAASGLFKYASAEAISRIEQDKALITRQASAIDMLELSLERQQQQFAKKDSIISAQQELIAGQAGYIRTLMKENDYLKKHNKQLAQQLHDEVQIDTLDSPLNRRKRP